jgi:hypothetical protein
MAYRSWRSDYSGFLESIEEYYYSLIIMDYLNFTGEILRGNDKNEPNFSEILLYLIPVV